MYSRPICRANYIGDRGAEMMCLRQMKTIYERESWSDRGQRKVTLIPIGYYCKRCKRVVWHSGGVSQLTDTI